MLFGFILLMISMIIFYVQLKKKNADRNVIVLFFALAGIITGVWFIFDWLMLHFVF
ncbi:hypothetical protein [Jeotgalibacillus salarius]|uniref:hypothetical protein n=1 Tax=Jeotgalibacillus salarius TaxID=546023 RepID=UPI00141BC541|nr:hypothetical protein [Jeotgalibacillus salarius]